MASSKRKQFKRERLFREQRGLCYYCDKPMLFTVRGNIRQRFRECTLDHLIPASKGGTLCDANLVAACHECNQKRSDKDARLFLLERLANG